MLGSKDSIQAIRKILSHNNNIPKIIDPVFKSSSGTWLLEKDSVVQYITEISGKASLLTPNSEEAFMISGIEIENLESMKKAAQMIHSMTGIPCFIKGGHFDSMIFDVLFEGKQFHIFKNKALNKKVHGTGCFLSSSILCFLVKGAKLKED